MISARLGFTLLALFLAARPPIGITRIQDLSQQEPSDLPRVLLFTRTTGFRHDSIPDGIHAVQDLGDAHGFEVQATEDPSLFTADKLAAFGAVIFLNTTGDVLDDRQQADFEHYIQTGGGFVGIHSAADTEYEWEWYGRLVGAYFMSHPAVQEATVSVTDRVHPSTRHLPSRWVRSDEWYDYRTNPRGAVHVLAAVEESSYEGGRMGHDHPIAWCHEFDGGRAWYTGGGHTSEAFAEPAFLQHLLGGIRWAAGLEDGNAGATISDHFEKVVLDDFVTDPMELAIAGDGRVLFIERGGVVKIWKPDTLNTVIAGFVDVFSALEDGLLGIALDPTFDETGWFYLFYSPAGDEPKNVLSRFTLAGDVLDPASEIVLLEIPTQRDECCHSGGSLTFDGAGNLFISTGDNTSPFASDGYTPIDEREGRAPFDAQKSSANVDDLRGKILRITPRAEGGYDIPEGNLFPRDGTQGRPEIYAMGCRNPFRISVDSETGILYWGDVGPDAGAPDLERGPAGHDEFNQARRPGNFGWPYLIAHNQAYVDYNFETGLSTNVSFDPASPQNDSPNNGGRRELPPAQPAWLSYSYAASDELPMFGSGGRCAMAGPVYHFDASLDEPHKLPAYYDGTLFIYEWARDWIMEVKLDECGDIISILPFAPSLDLARPMDLEIGPDGSLYLIEWGTGFGGGNPDAQVCRVEYHPSGQRRPLPIVEMDRTSGPVPLTVHFSGSASRSRAEPPRLDYAWDLDGDGSFDARGEMAEFTYEAPGRWNAQLQVKDVNGNSAVANVVICAGNTRPSISFQWPPDGGIARFGDEVAYAVSVHDHEDATIDEKRVIVQPFLGHDTHAHPLQQYQAIAGSFQILRDDGHGADADLFTVLSARYTDGGARGAPPLEARTEVILQPVRKQAEHASAMLRARLEKTADPTGGGQEVVFGNDGDWAMFRPVNLHRIDAVALRAGMTGRGGQLDVHLDAPEGELLGSARVEPLGAVPLQRGFHSIRVEYFERTGQAGLVLAMRRAGEAKEVIAEDAFRPVLQSGAIRTSLTGLRVEYFDIPDSTVIPEFSRLIPYAAEVVSNVDYAATDGEFAGSGRSDHVGAVFEGSILIEEEDEYLFSLTSDDGSRLFIDGKLIIDNDGLHAMTEKTAQMQWRTLEIPISDPGGTRDLYVVFRSDEPGGVEPVRLNWIEFVGPGVAEHRGEESETDAFHSH